MSTICLLHPALFLLPLYPVGDQLKEVPNSLWECKVYIWPSTQYCWDLFHFSMIWSNKEYFYSLLDAMLVHHRVTPWNLVLLIYTPGWAEALWDKYILSLKKSLLHQPGLEPRSLITESNVQAIKPPCLYFLHSTPHLHHTSIFLSYHLKLSQRFLIYENIGYSHLKIRGLTPRLTEMICYIWFKQQKLVIHTFISVTFSLQYKQQKA